MLRIAYGYTRTRHYYSEKTHVNTVFLVAYLALCPTHCSQTVKLQYEALPVCVISALLCLVSILRGKGCQHVHRCMVVADNISVHSRHGHDGNHQSDLTAIAFGLPALRIHRLLRSREAMPPSDHKTIIYKYLRPAPLSCCVVPSLERLS